MKISSSATIVDRHTSTRPSALERRSTSAGARAYTKIDMHFPTALLLSLIAFSVALIAVLAVRTGAAAPDPQSQADRMQQQAGREGVGDVLAYVGEVRRTADVRKNPKAFE